MVSLLQAGVRQVPLDDDGFLRDLADWDEEVAQALALAEGIRLTAEHWEILHAVRDFYQEFDLSPANRALVRYVRQQLGDEKGNSRYLNRLFSGKPALMASRLAGLPRPANCF